MTRIIKLQPNYVASNNRGTGYTIRPKLTLSGKWLEEAGFSHSTFINVEVENGRLVITSKE
jgi:hypothetical protein